MDSDEEDDNDGDDYGDGGTLPWVAREVERRAEIERQKNVSHRGGVEKNAMGDELHVSHRRVS